MPVPTRSRLTILSLGVSTACLVVTSVTAQTQIRSTTIDQNRERQEPSLSGQLAQSNTLDRVRQNLPASVKENETANSVINTVSSRVSEEMKGKSTEEIIRDAQDRIRRSREGVPQTTTITDTTESAANSTTAQPTAIPEPAASPRPPVATPTTPAPQAPPSAPTSGQLLTQAAPTPADTPPPGIGSSAPIPAPIPLQPRYNQEKKGGNTMTIESDESTLDNANRLAIFQGNVIVKDPNQTMLCEKLEIHMNDDTNLDGSPTAAGAQSAAGEEKAAFKKAIATGPMVQIEKVGEDGKVQIAKARRAEYDTASGDVVLTGGPPTLQTGKNFVDTQDENAVIILRKNGKYEVKGRNGVTGGRSTITIELPKGSAPSAGGALPGSLDSISNRTGDR